MEGGSSNLGHKEPSDPSSREDPESMQNSLCLSRNPAQALQKARWRLLIRTFQCSSFGCLFSFSLVTTTGIEPNRNHIERLGVPAGGQPIYRDHSSPPSVGRIRFSALAVLCSLEAVAPSLSVLVLRILTAGA